MGESPLTLSFRYPTTDGMSIVWRGAVETGWEHGWSMAQVKVDGPGEVDLELRIVDREGQPHDVHCSFEVLDLAPEDLHLEPIRPTVEILEAEDPARAFQHYFSLLSVAELQSVGVDRYRSSTLRKVRLETAVDPPSVAPLVEWRSSTRPPHLGTNSRMLHYSPGRERIEVGPPGAARRLELQSYAVRITNPISELEDLREGEPVTFEAVTDPPGYEQEITWLAATKHGRAQPLSGRGATFTVTFSDTEGADGQWLGVRADGDRREMDSKCLAPDLVPVIEPVFGQCQSVDGGYRVTVRNRGLRCSGQHGVQVLRMPDQGPTSLGFGVVPRLCPGQSFSLTIPLAGCCEQGDQVQIIADWSQQVDECFEDNNIGVETCGTIIAPPPESATRRTTRYLSSRVDGNMGFLLREVGGPVLASMNSGLAFEPASLIKTLIHLHGILDQQQQWGLAPPPAFNAALVVPWLADKCKFDQNGEYVPGGSDCYDNNTIARIASFEQAHRLMMEESDNALTQALRDFYGDIDIRQTITDLGLGSTRLRHSVGCGGQAIATPNRLTLNDLADLHDAAATGLFLPFFRTRFYDWMSNGRNFLNTVINEEAAALGLSIAERELFKGRVRTASKDGDYTLNGLRFVSIGGWLKLPFPCQGQDKEYFYGVFVDSATDLDLLGLGPETEPEEAVAEMLRDELRAALACSRP